MKKWIDIENSCRKNHILISFWGNRVLKTYRFRANKIKMKSPKSVEAKDLLTFFVKNNLKFDRKI